MLLGGGIAVVVIILGVGLFVMRRSSRPKTAADTAAEALAAGAAAPAALPASAEAGDFERRIREGELEQARLEAEVLRQITLPVATKATEVLIRHIRESSVKDPATAANVLRAWMNETGGKS